MMSPETAAPEITVDPLDSLPREVNPFEDQLVSEPRRAEKAVEKLNGDVLNKVLRSFRKLEGGGRKEAAKARDRDPSNLPKAVLLLSVAPGYGKSHLIGRLFRRLRGRATLVYVRPFQSPETSWESLLHKVVQELLFPETAGAEYCAESEPVQLEALAAGVLAHLMADLLQRGDLGHPQAQEAAEYLVENPFRAFGVVGQKGDWADWIESKQEDLCRLGARALEEQGVRLSPGNVTWLKVLFACALGRLADRERFDAAVAWLRGDPLEKPERDLLGLREREVAHADTGPGERNEQARRRLIDLTWVARSYRPFLFCFDQTEVYGVNRSLASMFGVIVSELRDNAADTLLVVTANRDPWERTLKPNIQDAHLDRIDRPIELDGLDLQMARELARNRMERWHIPAARQQEFLATIDDRIFGLAAARGRKLPSIGVRDFLKQCAALWAGIDEGSKIDLSLLYQTLIQLELASPRQLVFDADAFRWVVGDLALAWNDALETRDVDDGSGYFEYLWLTDRLEVQFGFESGSHFGRWGAILRRAKAHSERAGARNSRGKSVFFRTVEQRTIPGKWKSAGVFDDARRSFLDIWVLQREEIARIYAGWRMMADARSGDIEADVEETAAFLARELQWVRERVVAQAHDSLADPGGRGMVAKSEKPVAGTLAAGDELDRPSRAPDDAETTGGRRKKQIRQPPRKERTVSQTIGTASESAVEIAGASGIPPLGGPPDDAALGSGIGPRRLRDVEDIVKKMRFLTVEDLVKRLDGALTNEQALIAVGHLPQVRRYPMPKTTLLQWQNRRSV